MYRDPENPEDLPSEHCTSPELEVREQDPVLAYFAMRFPAPSPLREVGRVLYVGRLAPQPLPRSGVRGDIAAALAAIPDRRSRITR
jgi:hypothetical protein